MLAFNPPPLALITSTIARPLGAHRRVASRMTELVCAAWLTGCVTVPDVVEPPRMESFSVPYPAAARRLDQQGAVKLRLAYDATGAVQDARVVQSSGSPALDKAALAAVPRFRIRPGTRNGVPQSGVVVQPIRFSMPPVAEGGAPGAAQPAEEQVQR